MKCYLFKEVCRIKSIQRIVSIIIYTCLMIGMLLTGCSNYGQRNDVPNVEMWNSVKLIKFAYSNICEVDETKTVKEIYNYLYNTQYQRTDNNISNNPFAFQVNIEYGRENEEKYWRIYGINSECYIEDSQAKIWKSEFDFLQLLEHIYNYGFSH